MSEWEDVAFGPPASDGGEWEDVAFGAPAGPPESFGRRFANNLVAAANTINPFGDEGAAALRSMLPGYSSYDEELAAIRGGQTAHAEKHPYQAGASSVIGALATAPLLPSAIAGRASMLGKLGQAAAEGAGYGALYGAGNAEDGTRLEAAKEGAFDGAIAAPVLTGIGEGLSKGLSRASDDFLKMALNVQRSDLQQAAKFAGKRAAEESPLLPAIKGARERGLFKGAPSAEEIIETNNEFIQELGGKVSSVLKQADAVQTDVVIPTFQRAQSYIAQRPYEAESLAAQLKRRLATINQEWDGSVSGANDLKQKLYRISYKNNTESSGLDKAIASDLKTFIEEQADDLLGSEAAEVVRNTNAQIGEHLTLDKLLQKSKFQNEMPGGLAKGLRRAVVSPIGGGAAGGLGYLITGDPDYAYAGVAGAALASRPGQFALSGLAGKLSQGALGLGSKSGALVGSIIGNANNSLSGEQEDQQAGQGKAELQPQPRQVEDPPSRQTSNGQASPNSPNIFQKNQPSIFMKKSSVVSDEILDAVRKVETGSKPNQTSSAGAQGPYQLMPATGREWHEKLKIKEDYDPFNEPQARKIAGAYLGWLIEQFGDLETALTAYHTGPGNVRKGNIGPIGRRYAQNVLDKLVKA